MSAKRILLVEGEADRGFFQALARRLSIRLDLVQVCTPREFGKKNTKQGVLHALEYQIPGLMDGSIERLAVVLDADSADSGGLGYAKTVQQMSAVLEGFGFSLDSSFSPGLVYSHSDGLNPFGAWVMPNNGADGMLEDWVKTSLHAQESSLMAHAEASIDAIPGGAKFKPLHRIKAEVATWLAWQTKPEHGLFRAAEEVGLLAEDSPSFVDLQKWFKTVFP